MDRVCRTFLGRPLDRVNHSAVAGGAPNALEDKRYERENLCRDKKIFQRFLATMFEKIYHFTL
jgi:hypothetical protein